MANKTVLFTFWIMNTIFAILDLAFVSYVARKNKCKFTCIIKLVFIIGSTEFFLKAIFTGYQLFDKSQSNNFSVTMNLQLGAFIDMLYIMIALKTHQIYVKLMRSRN